MEAADYQFKAHDLAQEKLEYKIAKLEVHVKNLDSGKQAAHEQWIGCQAMNCNLEYLFVTFVYLHSRLRTLGLFSLPIMLNLDSTFQDLVVILVVSLPVANVES